MFLEQNLRGLCQQYNLDFFDFLNDMEIDSVDELTIADLQILCEEYKVDLMAVLFKPLYLNENLSDKLSKIKLLVLDVDGVMTDGGMYYTENGDQFKKYNTKDGMAIQYLVKQNFQIAIISSGYKAEMVKARASLLGIQNCHVGREPKLEILEKLCIKLNLELEQVALIGDDINDLEMMKKIGFSACPSDAVDEVKLHSDIILKKKGGKACVREFIDDYLLKCIPI